MSDNVYVNRDRTKVVEEWTAGKKYQMPRAEAARLGLLDSPDKPTQERRSGLHAQRTVEHVGPLADKPKRRYTKRK